MNKTKAFAIAAIRSGDGKTTITLGIMAALVKRGLQVQPFKAGPDFIDPSLHKYITGKSSYNLDLKMMGEKCIRKIFYEKSKESDVSVIEGVMGLFDGGSSSTAETVKTIDIPVILVIDARSCAESAVAIVKGFESYDVDVSIQGVIFNKIGSDRHKELIDLEMKKKSSVSVIGYIKKDPAFEIPQRHLGLLTGEEKPLGKSNLKRLVETIESSLDLNLLISNSKSLPDDTFTPTRPLKNVAKVYKKLAVAMDDAFSFYYQQNLEIMENEGFKIVPFSPIYDRKVPDEADMIYFGGGYPELYAVSLSKNIHMIEDIRYCFTNGVPIYGECGGFMYLCDTLVDFDGRSHKMTALFPFQSIMNKRLRKLGYRQVKLVSDCLLGSAGETVYGHEYHYSHISNTGFDETENGMKRLYSLDNNSHEGYIRGSAAGSYIHIHCGRTLSVVKTMFNRAGYSNNDDSVN